MDQATCNKIVSFIWGNADDVLRGRKSRGTQSPLRTPLNISADILAFLRQRLEQERGVWAERGLTLHCYALAPILKRPIEEQMAAGLRYAVWPLASLVLVP